MILTTQSLLATAALVALQFAAPADAFAFRNNLEIVHGDAPAPPQYAASYYSVFARDDDPEPDFELLPISIKDKIVSLKRRAISGCDQEHTVKRGDTCHEITQKYGIHLEDFYYWNPSVNSRCKNLKVGRKYCVKNSDAGSSPDACSVRHKVVAGDTCTSVARQYGISSSKFLAMNTNVSSGCKNLKIGHSYCISTASESSSSSDDAAAAKKEAAEKASAYEREEAKKKEQADKDAAAAAAEEAKNKEEAEKAAADAAAEKKKQEEEVAAAAEKKKQEEEAAAAEEKQTKDKITNLASKTKDSKKDDDDDDWKKTETPVKGQDDDESDSDSSSSPSTEQRKAIHHSIPMTYYWIAMPEDYKQSGKQVSIKTCDGKTLGTTSVEYADALVMEGTGVLGNKIVNLGACSCTNYNCFMEVNKNEDPYGLTSYSTPLRPYITAAANDIPRGSKVYVPQLDGASLPGTSKKHNGCLLVDDKGWSFSSKHLDFYVYAMKNYESMNSALGVSKVDVYQGGSCKLLDYM